MTLRVALIGARGHVGRELIALLNGHPGLDLTLAGSRQLAGETVPGTDGLVFSQPTPDEVATHPHDVTILALPNEKSAPFVDALRLSGTLRRASARHVVIDLSGDHRFSADWYYGLPELTRANGANARWISNPGCYATAMQLAIAPLADLLAGPARCFGVSGYSGAGTTPSPRNDPEVLHDNLLAYSPVAHLHEREVAHQLDVGVHFLPHVAAFFRGILLSADVTLSEPLEVAAVHDRYRRRYAAEPLVNVSEAAPDIAQIRGRHHACVGGFAADPDTRRVVVYCALDNLLKGAATQAVQNINVATGCAEFEGIEHDNANLG